MVRVVHLLDSEADFSTERGSAALAHRAGTDFDITSRTIGPGGDDRNAVLAWFNLRGAKDADVDVVHAWSVCALWVAVLAGARANVFSPPQLPGRRSLRWIAAAVKRRRIHVVCASEAEQRVYAGHGVGPGQCSVIRPGVDVTTNKPPRDSALRAALGFSEEDYVLLAPGESTRAAGHRDAFWTAGILHKLDPRYRILLWGRGEKTGSLAHLAEKVRQSATLAVAEQRLGRRIEFGELLMAANAVLFTPSGPTPILPLAMCMAAGLPIVAIATPRFDELLQDGRNAAMVPRRSSRMLAQRVIEVREDPALALRLGETARAEARDLFSTERFVEEYRAVYRKIGASGKS